MSSAKGIQAAVTAPVPAPVDQVHVKFPSQYKHLIPGNTYFMTFGEVLAYRNNPACPKPEIVGANASAYLAFEKAQPKS